MIRSFLINKYLAKEFIKIVINTSIIFFCLGFIMNIFEEINFFKDFSVSITTPIILSLLFVPSLLNYFFPFAILLSGIWFFLKIKKTDELTAMNVSGMSNLSVIIIPSILSIILGIFFVTALNPITSLLVKKYEAVKGNYEKEQDYLATVTVNGIWIKERGLKANYMIRASHLEKENLMGVTIYEFDKDNNFTRRIEADSANITSLKWVLKNITVINSDGIVLTDPIKDPFYFSMYDIKKIKSLYSNLDTISFWDLEHEINLLKQRGYSTREMQVKLHRSLAFPFFLLSMLLLSSVFTLGTTFKENNWTYVFLTIISSVLIFFFNDFSTALGKTDKLPVELSVWMPIAIIFIFSFVGIIHANQK
jgi:lipopolysaccharide export system permease protein